MTPGKYICDSVSAGQEYLLRPGYVEFLGMLKNADINDEKEYSLLEEAGVETFLWSLPLNWNILGSSIRVIEPWRCDV